MITVQSPTSVLIDDVSSGQVADCIANHPQLASDIQRALVIYVESLEATAQQEITQITAARDAAKADLAANVAYQTEALARAAAVIDSGDMSGLPAVLEFAGASFAERQRAEKLAKAAALEAEAAALRA